MSTLHIAPDAHGDPTIWLGDLDAAPIAVVTRHQIGVEAFGALSALIGPETAPLAATRADGGTGTVALDLDALRAVAEERARTLSAATVLDYERTFPPPTALALIERAEKAEAELTRLREALEALQNEWWNEPGGSSLLNSQAAVRLMHLLAGGEGQ